MISRVYLSIFAIIICLARRQLTVHDLLVKHRCLFALHGRVVFLNLKEEKSKQRQRAMRDDDWSGGPPKQVIWPLQSGTWQQGFL